MRKTAGGDRLPLSPFQRAARSDRPPRAPSAPQSARMAVLTPPLDGSRAVCAAPRAISTVILCLRRLPVRRRAAPTCAAPGPRRPTPKLGRRRFRPGATPGRAAPREARRRSGGATDRMARQRSATDSPSVGLRTTSTRTISSSGGHSFHPGRSTWTVRYRATIGLMTDHTRGGCM